jgi:hypothetical protein
MLQRALIVPNFVTFTKWNQKKMWYLFIPAAITTARTISKARAKEKINKHPVAEDVNFILCEKKLPFHMKRNFHFV